eukprot:7408321-Karenia_brevis.AAC.1
MFLMRLHRRNSLLKGALFSITGHSVGFSHGLSRIASMDAMAEMDAAPFKHFSSQDPAHTE